MLHEIFLQKPKVSALIVFLWFWFLCGSFELLSLLWVVMVGGELLLLFYLYNIDINQFFFHFKTQLL
ncbi:hypothetical protein SE23_00700 [Vibrio sinaloensis]|nr:hypothetical protein SE23_00700 [Vibrio sinaloensis]